MRRLLPWAACTALMAFFSASQLHADVLLQFDLDTAADGIQLSRSAEIGETFDVDVVMTLVGPEDLASFSFDALFDGTYINVLGVTIPDNRPAGFEQPGTVTFDNVAGTLGTFAGGPSASGTLGASNGEELELPILGTISLTTLNPTSSAVTEFLTFANGNFDGLGGVNFDAGAITIAAIPEPSSLALCGLICGGVLARRSRRDRRD